jgi:predicted  nucleic acid-binding Zn-ribbon protein
VVTKQCIVCGSALPQRRRSDRRYCGCKCRVRAFRIRNRAQQLKARGPTRSHDGYHAAPSSAGDATVAEADQKIRQELEDKIATLEDQLARVEEKRDLAIAAADRQQPENSIHRRKRVSAEKQQPDPTLKRLDRELSRVKARLHDKTDEARRYLS